MSGLVRSLFLGQVKIRLLVTYMVWLDIPLSRKVCCQLAVGRATIYIGGPHTHRDTDAHTVRNPTAPYCKGANCVL